MVTIPPNSSAPIGGAPSTATQSTVDAPVDMSSWFGSEVSSGNLLNVSPPPSYRSMGPAELADEVLKHLGQ